MISITENGNVRYENQTDVDRELLANEKSPKYYYDETVRLSAAAQTAQEAAEEAAEAAMASTPEGYADFVDNLAPAYSSSATYSAGDYVLHESILYRANADISTAEDWTAAHWTEVRTMTEVSDLKEDLGETQALTGVTWYNGYYQPSDHAFVGTEWWKTSNSIPCTPGDTFIYCGASSQTNRVVVGFWDRANNFLSGLTNLGTNYTEITVTVPNNAEFFRVLAQTTDLSRTYVIYGGSAIQTPLYANRKRIISAEDAISALDVKTTVCYVDGSAESDGTGTQSSPFNSIASALSAGYQRIKATSGVYSVDQIRIEDEPFSLTLWSNVSNYDTDIPDREKIILFKGDILAPTVSGSEVSVAYTPTSGRRFEKVFVTSELTPIDSSFTYATAYNVNVFMWKCGHVARRYEPVLPENYTGAEGTFTYEDGYIKLTLYSTDTDNDLSLYISDDPSIPLYFDNADKIELADVAVVGAYYGGAQIHGCQLASVRDCEFVCTGHGDGIEVFDSNVTLTNCVATGCAQDGYGFQYYGESKMENCNAYYSGDDGVSHHRGCKGYIIGGEYSYNGSGGITPAFGAEVDIANTITIGNDNGLQFFGATGYPSRDLTVFGCVSKNNSSNDIYNDGYDITFVNCVYDTEHAASGHTNTFL